MKKKKTAIIFGVSGQDGSYLSHFLYNKGYKVIGVTRNKSLKNLYRLKILDILKKINVIQGEASNLKFCKKILSSRIDEIYFLAGQSSVTESFENPQISLNSNVVGLLNILKTIKDNRYKIRLFNAGSAQFYGDNKNYKYNLNSQINPQSPYGISKAAAYWLVKMYREKYNILCCTGILFNHESCLRSDEFVTKKIINISKKIKNNKKIKLRLGNINIYRDWGWAPEYVEAFWLMLQQKKTQDLILGTGKIHSLKEFVYEVFRLLKIDKKNLKHNIKKFNRKLDIRGYRADINQAKNKINWKAKTNFKKIIFKMVNDELF
jgi:GDPmannose 4,6-dehydratase